MRRGGIAARIALASLVVGGVTLAIVAIGVIRVGSDAFAAAMAAAGDSVEHARQMFDQSVTLVVILAGLVAAIGAVAPRRFGAIAPFGGAAAHQVGRKRAAHADGGSIPLAA